MLNKGNKNTEKRLNAGKEKLGKIFPFKTFGHSYNLILSRKYLTGRFSAFLILENCQSLSQFIELKNVLITVLIVDSIRRVMVFTVQTE